VVFVVLSLLAALLAARRRRALDDVDVDDDISLSFFPERERKQRFPRKKIKKK